MRLGIRDFLCDLLWLAGSAGHFFWDWFTGVKGTQVSQPRGNHPGD